ncbi:MULTISPECIES: IclR family transcriptional regulator [unclassified Roseovarius]|jgi:DNA-binding IclR family transcriptional regulator|uniref:IclR family transcriptional regulator n=1 Tax=unclassified Roseovarius TaxID=2614913 RepID=UPI000068490E|nr:MULTISPECIES: IclR family transcriptional regulator [unclassified Roseovarius]EAQ25731.1 transcriptional regulator, IclR family protein [Roseovarius sp. 217]KJS40845.1 MAG: ArsR family transcriptional regulator [Roseovarius sp. BRH_c41]
MDGEDSATIPTNLRLLLVIEEIARVGVPITPTEVNAAIGLPKPTIHRLFATLEEEGFLQRDLDGRSYSPGPRLRTLAGGVLSSLRIRTARQAVLQRLSRQIGETCNIALPDRDAMIYLERIETEWPLRIQLPIGTRVPFYCTASGKMYLSTLARSHLMRYLGATDLEARTPNTLTDPDALLHEIQQVRVQGYSLDREEFMEDMIALAVPILDVNDRLMATLAFHAPTQRFSIEKAMDYLGIMREAASDLSQLVA